MPKATIVVELEIALFEGTSNFRLVTEPSINKFSLNSYESRKDKKVVDDSIPETIGILRYQPAPKWTLLAKAMYWKQGLDTGGRSFGSNIFFQANDQAHEVLFVPIP